MKITQPKKKKQEKTKVTYQTFTWTPPSKEEIAAQKQKERESMLAELKEIGIFLEGMKKGNALSLYPLGHSHLSSLWKAIAEIKEKK